MTTVGVKKGSEINLEITLRTQCCGICVYVARTTAHVLLAFFFAKFKENCPVIGLPVSMIFVWLCVNVVGEANSGKASKSVATSSSMGQAQEKASLAKSEIGQAKMVGRPRSFLLCLFPLSTFLVFLFLGLFDTALNSWHAGQTPHICISAVSAATRCQSVRPFLDSGGFREGYTGPTPPVFGSKSWQEKIGKIKFGSGVWHKISSA